MKSEETNTENLGSNAPRPGRLRGERRARVHSAQATDAHANAGHGPPPDSTAVPAARAGHDPPSDSTAVPAARAGHDPPSDPASYTPDTELVPTQLAPTQPATPQRDRAARALSFGAATPFVAKNSREGSASTRLSSATPSPTPPAPPPAAEDDLAAALSDLGGSRPGEDASASARQRRRRSRVAGCRARSARRRAGAAVARRGAVVDPAFAADASRRTPAQRHRGAAARATAEDPRAVRPGAAVGAPPLANGRIAKAVADLIRRDEEDAGPTLVLAASGPAADEWIAALTLALGPHCDVLKHATTAAALRRNTPARLARMTCVVATYAQASRADPREARTAPASEWLSSARPVAAQDSVLHRLTWHRAVYDEAHSLLGTSKRARAAETLDANFTWAVFGPVTLDQLSRKPAQLRALATVSEYLSRGALSRSKLERTVFFTGSTAVPGGGRGRRRQKGRRKGCVDDGVSASRRAIRRSGASRGGWAESCVDVGKESAKQMYAVSDDQHRASPKTFTGDAGACPEHREHPIPWSFVTHRASRSLM